MATDELYLFLNSTVSSPFSSQKNSPSSFRTLFDTPIYLDLNSEYEMAILTLTCSAHSFNISDGTFSYYSYIFGTEMHSRIPEGQYTIEKFNEVFMRVIQGDSSFYELSYEEEIRKFKLHTTSGDGGVTQPDIKFSKNLERFSGFPSNIYGSGNFYSTNSYSTTSGNDHLYIYSDIVHSSYVKNTKQPILNVFPYVPNERQEILVCSPCHPVYIPIFLKTIQGISINIKNKQYEDFPFPEDSETTAVLHLRPLVSHF